MGCFVEVEGVLNWAHSVGINAQLQVAFITTPQYNFRTLFILTHVTAIVNRCIRARHPTGHAHSAPSLMCKGRPGILLDAN